MCLGRTVLSAEEWSQVIRALHLTEQEAAIAMLIFDDRCDQGIADELRISPHTVHSHICRMYTKLRVSSRVQLVIRVFAAR